VFGQVSAQTNIEGVAAVVGNKIILRSAIEGQYQQWVAQGGEGDEEAVKCQLLEDALYQKLLAHQAEVDSVMVSESEVQDAIEQRIQYFVSQIGSEEKLEAYFGKSIQEIKEEFKGLFKDQLLAQRMEGRITAGVKVTPEDVRKFYNAVPQDSLPVFPLEMEVSQIVMFPSVSKSEEERIKEKLKGFKERVNKGEDFKILATLYSEDKGSASQGGELGFLARGILVPEFEAAAFRLQAGEMSEIVKTQFGYHIIQMIERRGEQINVRHILIKPRFSQEDINAAQHQLDSVVQLIGLDSLSFEEAAYRFSNDKQSKNNGGLLLNPQTGTAAFAAEEMDPSIFFVVDKMEEGTISESVAYTTRDERKAVRVLKLNKKTPSHKANLQDDYDRIHTVALQSKKAEVSQEWIEEKIAETYIDVKVDLSCDFKNNWIK
jgi:peptidyl-prolyl cis-trans isomerase SurA